MFWTGYESNIGENPQCPLVALEGDGNHVGHFCDALGVDLERPKVVENTVVVGEYGAQFGYPGQYHDGAHIPATGTHVEHSKHHPGYIVALVLVAINGSEDSHESVDVGTQAGDQSINLSIGPDMQAFEWIPV